MARRNSAARIRPLTVREILAAKDGDHSDGNGLMLRVRGEAASWVLRYTSATGKRREMGLGSADRTNDKAAGKSVDTARDLALENRALLKRGLDPIDERDKANQAKKAAEVVVKSNKARQRLTLARAARAYHERVIEPKKSVKHAAQWIASLENHMPARIWHKPIADIEPPELLEALSEVKAHERARNMTSGSTAIPETLQRIRQRLDAVFEDAIFHKHCTSNPAAAIKRKMAEELPGKTNGEFRALPYAEAPAFLSNLRGAPGIAARCLELGMLTAARTNEILTAEWAEIDLDLRTWTVPASKMKGGELHVVYLSPAAVSLLEQQKGLDKIYVFPSTRLNGSPMSNMAMLVLLGRMGMRGKTTVHGLCRATFSTWANETAAARPDVIEACLAHREGDKVRGAYNRAQFANDRRALLEAWANYLQTPRGQVIPLRA